IEPSISGPKDSFTENYQTNIGLIKRRIKSSSLKIEGRIVGRKTSTQIGVLYFDDITDKNMVKTILEKIDTIDIDGILDSSSLAFLLDGENKSIYPTVYQTERPDIVSMALLEGKIVIMVDTSPFALILPSYLIDYINPNFDNYNKSLNINFIKLLRIFAFFITIATPALYVALINFNQEAIPTTLLINFAIQRDGVPFPAVIETIIMLFVCEVLRESDLRFPSNYGSAISVLGAIIIGEASVSAGIVTPIMIIIVAITFISNLIFTNAELNNAIRFFRVVFLIGAAIFGLYGLALAFLFFLTYTLNTTSFNRDYLAPFSPYDKAYFNDTVIKQPIRKDTQRSKLFVKENLTKEKENL
ncbi:MAG: spore germination protein, partial [Bacilli bacterium]|nr:spore germination protein [Bacilli bacterium]